MNLPARNFHGPHRSPAAFTVTELIICTSLFLLLVGGVVSANLFGLRMFQITETKLNATDGVRKAIGTLSDEIRSCRNMLVGNVTNDTFVALATGVQQIGTGLIIYPTTNTASYALYFVNPADQTLRRATQQSGSTRILARAITNAAAIFQAQDYLGNILTNSQANTVIRLNLEFYQATRYGVPPDYFNYSTSVTRRSTQ